MSIHCPRCTYDNPDQSSFCIRCGATLQGGSIYNQTFTPGQTSFATGSPGPGAQQQQAFAAQAIPNLQASQAAASSVALAPPAQGLGSFRRAFAGHGTLIKHHSWLLNGQQSNALVVRQAVMDKIGQRKLDNLSLVQENLTDQSVVEERRDYIKAKRKAATMFIYVVRAGQDLYISRATTVLPAFSMLRTIAFGLILLAIFLPLCNIMVSASSLSAGIANSGTANAAAGAGVGILLSLVFMLFFSLPLLWILLVALGRSITSFILDKDLWVLLRPNTLTEFQRDDIALLEHETDDIIRDALKQLGLDADKIVPPTDGYQAKSRIRWI
ncbi:MAG: hypothetical protein M3Z08_20785 [Chloroflexota bacterium]|nr:hypothetical protein [Chloroflexota bacterium]